MQLELGAKFAAEQTAVALCFLPECLHSLQVRPHIPGLFFNSCLSVVVSVIVCRCIVINVRVYKYLSVKRRWEGLHSFVLKVSSITCYYATLL